MGSLATQRAERTSARQRRHQPMMPRRPPPADAGGSRLFACRFSCYNHFMTTVRVKICGLTNEQDAHDAVCAGADALGFNFFKESPRYIAEERAAAIIRGLPPFVEPVALFVD